MVIPPTSLWPGYPNDLLKRIGQLKKTVRRKKVVEQAATGSGTLAVGGKVWDQAPGLLATPEVVIDLESGDAYSGRPEQFIRTACPTKWRGIKKQCPLWESFLHQVFDGDEEMVKFVQRLLGYAIAGLVARKHSSRSSGERRGTVRAP